MKKVTLLITLLLLFSCGDKREESTERTVVQQLEEHLELEKEIVQTPADIVAITAALEIRFREPIVSGHLSGTTLDQNPFVFAPAIAGHAEWTSQTTLRFVPDENLPPGQKFEATLLGKILFGEQKNVNDFEFAFRVAEQEILTFEGDFEPVADVKNGLKYKGTLTFAQPVQLERIENQLKLQGPQRTLQLSVQSTGPGRIAVTSELLYRRPKGQNFTFTLPQEYRASDKEWQRSVFLPGIDVFRVMSYMDVTNPEAEQPVYAFRFSDPIKTNSDLSGYLTITPELPYSMRVQGKKLLVQGDFVPGRSYTAKIAQGFPCEFGTKLSDTFTAAFSFENIKPEVKWLSDGVYLPTGNNFRLQFRSVNVSKVRITVTEIYSQNLGFFIQENTVSDLKQRRDDYYSTYAYRDLSRVGANIFSKELQITDSRNEWSKTELDLTPVFKDKKNSAFVVQLTFGANDLAGRCVNARDQLSDGDLYFDGDNYYTNPCQPGYYNSRGYLSRLLLASDTALTLKKADDGIHVFATDVQSARPVKGLTLGMYSYQNKLLESQRTDNNGHVQFSEQGAYVFSVNSAGIALLKLNHPAWQLNNFDVAGSSGGRKGTDVFMYTERGVHRPGDTIHLAAIVRINRSSPPEKTPAILKVRNARGQLVYETKKSCGKNGHIYLPIQTDLADPTGTWTAQLEVGGLRFNKELRVETVKPVRLKTEFDLPDEVYQPQTILAGTVTSKYLFGAPAAGLRTNIRLDLTGRDFRPAQWAGYVFTTPLKHFSRQSKTIYDGALDASGQYSLDYALPGRARIPSLLYATVRSTVYEKGGNFKEETKSTTIFPYSAFVGIKNIFDRSSARVGENYEIPIAAVDADGKSVARHKLKIKLYVNRGYWWWHYDRRDRRDFIGNKATYLLEETSYTSETAPLKHKILLEDYGQHYLEVLDETTGHTAGLFFYSSGWGRTAQPVDGKRNYLQITSDKNIYNVGDQATLTFQTPEQGMALFSLEQGNRIIRSEWKEVSGSETDFSFPVTDELVPNFYASVSLIQPHNQNTNDLPMRLYGIKTVYVEEPATRLPLSMTAPAELKPKESFEIAVTSHAARTATYTLAVVDEGLLDLTDFQTPQPWQHYFKKLRLGVSTTDNFDQIIGVLYPDMDKYFSIGGDLDDSQRKKRVDRSRVKRFKPVVLYEEPVTIEPGKTVKSSFTMPNYVGAVRVMLVASAGHSYTSVEKTIPVKQPLMILTTVPRVARPGDVFALPVSVFVMDSSVTDVTLAMELSANLTAVGDKKARVSFSKPGEQDVAFSVKVGDAIGADTTTVVATANGTAADNTVHLPVTSPNPFYTEVTDTVVLQGQTVTLVPHKIGLKGTNAARLAFSRIPDLQLDKRLNYLIRYPYGCIEQTVSGAFPQLYLPSLLDLRSHQKQAVTDNINAAVERLANFKISKGFSYWPASDGNRPRYSDWGSSYAGHFLIAARELGYHVPDELYDHWLRQARSRASAVKRSNHRYQTYRLFLLALAGEPHLGGMNLVRENHLAELDPVSRRLLATAYYLSGKQDVGRELEKSAPTEITSYRELSGTYGSSLRDRALMAYLALKMDDLKTAGTLMRDIAKSFSPHGWYSTQETAVALLTLGSFYKTSSFSGGAVQFKIKMADGKTEKKSFSGYQMLIELEELWEKEISVTVENNNPLFVTLFSEGIPLESKIESAYSGIELTRNYYDEDGRATTVTERGQGKPFWVIYRVKSVNSQPLQRLALSSMFPSGWEVSNARLTGTALPSWVQNKRLSSGNYMDIRDDRVNWFFDLRPRRDLFFGVKINPTFKGTFTLPPVVVEAMYSPEFYARIKGGKVTVN